MRASDIRDGPGGVDAGGAQAPDGGRGGEAEAEERLRQRLGKAVRRGECGRGDS